MQTKDQKSTQNHIIDLQFEDIPKNSETSTTLDSSALKILSQSLMINSAEKSACSKNDLTTDSSKKSTIEDPNSDPLVPKKKQYAVTSDDSRRKFIELWTQGNNTIKQAAIECGINYSTAKSIVKLLKLEGRIDKKKKRASRKMKKEKEELERLLLGSLKRQKVEIPNLSPLDPQFLQQKGIQDSIQISKERQLAQKACDSQMTGLAQDFFTFSMDLPIDNRLGVMKHRNLQEGENSLFPILPQDTGKSENQGRQQQFISHDNHNIQQTLEKEEMALQGALPQSESSNQQVKRCLPFEALVALSIDQDLDLKNKGTSFLHTLYV